VNLRHTTVRAEGLPGPYELARVNIVRTTICAIGNKVEVPTNDVAGEKGDAPEGLDLGNADSHGGSRRVTKVATGDTVGNPVQAVSRGRVDSDSAAFDGRVRGGTVGLKLIGLGGLRTS
jgi:hypothetical protein